MMRRRKEGETLKTRGDGERWENCRTEVSKFQDLVEHR